MGISKTEINLRRLLAAAPQQQNQAKLIHYVATLREQLEQLAEERTPEGLPRPCTYLLELFPQNIKGSDALRSNSLKTSTSKSDGETQAPSSPGLRRRFVPASNLGDRTQGTVDADTSEPVKLDAQAHAHIEKQRKLQESLTDEMVGLARQLKESSLLISQSVQNTEKVLDSTEKAIEQSLASTGHTNMRAMKIYSESSKTTCFTWLLMLVMTCIFIMVVLLIRVT
ncbi:hypothetical protein CUMW_184230 [Citrus unshiu]|nr:hypothetical protein CUMW_184230 [Citrus unshiu]